MAEDTGSQEHRRTRNLHRLVDNYILPHYWPSVWSKGVNQCWQWLNILRWVHGCRWIKFYWGVLMNFWLTWWGLFLSSLSLPSLLLLSQSPSSFLTQFPHSSLKTLSQSSPYCWPQPVVSLVTCMVRGPIMMPTLARKWGCQWEMNSLHRNHKIAWQWYSVWPSVIAHVWDKSTTNASIYNFQVLRQQRLPHDWKWAFFRSEHLSRLSMNESARKADSIAVDEISRKLYTFSSTTVQGLGRYRIQLMLEGYIYCLEKTIFHHQ